MSTKGDSRRLKRAKYHDWIHERWRRRNKAAAEKRAARLKGKREAAS